MLILPVIAALCYGEYREILSFLYAAICLLATGFLLAPKSPKNKKLGSKEGLLTVGLSWILVSLLGAFPFFFSGAIPNYFNAVFETVSGFTTTGATILTDVEALPKCMLLWRSLAHWRG